jgi:hypothetical protein
MVGQASPTGSAVYNQDLSRRRVKHVEQLMRDFTGAKSHMNPTATGIPVGVKTGGEQSEFRRVVVSFEAPGASPGPHQVPNPARSQDLSPVRSPDRTRTTSPTRTPSSRTRSTSSGSSTR